MILFWKSPGVFYVQGTQPFVRTAALMTVMLLTELNNSMDGIIHLRKNGYRVEICSPWHYKVIGKRTYVNVWPTKRKYMLAFGSGASFYRDADDLLSIVNNLIGKRRNVRWLIDQIIHEYESRRTDADREAEKAWRAAVTTLSTEIREMVILRRHGRAV